jgi:hypothetical protein
MLNSGDNSNNKTGDLPPPYVSCNDEPLLNNTQTGMAPSAPSPAELQVAVQIQPQLSIPYGMDPNNVEAFKEY